MKPVTIHRLLAELSRGCQHKLDLTSQLSLSFSDRPATAGMEEVDKIMPRLLTLPDLHFKLAEWICSLCATCRYIYSNTARCTVHNVILCVCLSDWRQRTVVKKRLIVVTRRIPFLILRTEKKGYSLSNLNYSIMKSLWADHPSSLQSFVNIPKKSCICYECKSHGLEILNKTMVVLRSLLGGLRRWGLISFGRSFPFSLLINPLIQLAW